MIDAVILSWVTFIYLASFIFYVLNLVSGKNAWGLAGTTAAIVGFAGHTLAMILRWKTSYEMGIGHVPLTNYYESLIFFAWTIVLLYLIFEWRLKNRSLGALVLPLTFFAMAYASLSPAMDTRIKPLIPALQSNWLTSHVFTCFMGYAAFAVACAFALMHLIGSLEDNTKPGPRMGLKKILSYVPTTNILDELIYQSVVLGFIFLSIGIITGAVWAHYAWGSYWSWDPKETWSLITWLIYATILHARFVRGWRGRRIAWMSIIGFISVLFTYLGVNYLPSLHSYM
jgi:cytochrome c-type biogenesis protein CcsB